MKEIQVIIGKDGNARMEANGFTGGVCEQTLNELLVAVGGVEESQTEKPEYYDDDGALMDEIFNSNN